MQAFSPSYLIPFERVAGGSDWQIAFAEDRPLRVEIGFGKDAFLIKTAEREPGFNYLGVEYSRKRVRKFLGKVTRSGIESIRVLRCNIVPLLDKLFYPGQVDTFYANFPDPWPKKRHAKNRLVQDRVVEVLANRLLAGGRLRFRTDVQPYALQMVEVLERVPALRAVGEGISTTEPPDHIPTLYEMKYRREGRPIYLIEYEKREY